MSSTASSGSICDLWGVAYPSDFIPSGGGFYHHHYQQRLHKVAPVAAKN